MVFNVSLLEPNCTPHAQAAIAAARSLAERSGSTYIGPEHLLQAVLGLSQCGAVKTLAQLGVSLEAVQQGRQSHAGPRKAPASGSERKLLGCVAITAEELKRRGHWCVRAEHILLGILNETDSLPAQVLLELGVTAKQVRRAIAEGGGWAVGRD